MSIRLYRSCYNDFLKCGTWTLIPGSGRLPGTLRYNCMICSRFPFTIRLLLCPSIFLYIVNLFQSIAADNYLPVKCLAIFLWTLAYTCIHPPSPYSHSIASGRWSTSQLTSGGTILDALTAWQNGTVVSYTDVCRGMYIILLCRRQIVLSLPPIILLLCLHQIVLCHDIMTNLILIIVNIPYWVCMSQALAMGYTCTIAGYMYMYMYMHVHVSVLPRSFQSLIATLLRYPVKCN